MDGLDGVSSRTGGKYFTINSANYDLINVYASTMHANLDENEKAEYSHLVARDNTCSTARANPFARRQLCVLKAPWSTKLTFSFVMVLQLATRDTVVR